MPALLEIKEKRVTGVNIPAVVDDLEAALEQFWLIANDLGHDTATTEER